MLLEFLGSLISSYFGVAACAGLTIYMGLILLFSRPSDDWGEDPLVRIVGFVWTAIGVIAAIQFILSRLEMSRSR